MQTIKIFIACAGKSKGLAKDLKTSMEELDKDNNFWEIIPWFDEQSGVRNKYGPSILDNLREECLRVDLAVILLTQDDLKIPINSIENKDSDKTVDSKEMIPRDNCIFEAGLFMGGLGLDPARCVIITSVDKPSLPDDLQSVHYMRFEENEINDKEKCKSIVKRLASEIHLHTQQNLLIPPKRPFLPIYTPKELVEREKPRTQGGDIVDTSGLGVVVNTVQPVETKVTLAERVVKNMKAGIEYYYFFRAEPRRMREVAALIQALVLANLGESEDLPDDKRVAVIQKYAKDGTRLEESIKQIQKKLFIHFLPIERLPLYFCVHNALQDKLARCYLRYPGESDFFIPWAEQEAAYAVAKDLLDLSEPEDRQSIFYATEYFDIYARTSETNKLRKSIQRELKYMFSDDGYKRIQNYLFA